jgi:hypothetical protein
MAFGDFTVTRASTKLRIGSNGLYGSVANNVPAFEFNADGSYRGLLVEPGATNLALNSQDFTNATWAKTVSASVTGNTGIAPDGTLTADTFTAGADGSQIQYSFVGSSGVVHTASFFIRRITGTGVVNIRSVENVNTPVTITSSWQRYSVTATSTTTTIRIGMSLNTNGDEVEIWQAQLETGSVATSPIVTTAGTASRVADAITLASASSLIGQTEGGIFVKVNTRLTAGGVGKRILVISDGTSTNRIQIVKSTTDRIDCIVTVGGATQANLASATNRSGIFIIGVRYKLNDFALYLNGASIDTDLVGTVPACSQVNLGCGLAGGEEFNDHIEYMFLLPSAPTNAQLTSLTTL